MLPGDSPRCAGHFATLVAMITRSRCLRPAIAAASQRRSSGHGGRIMLQWAIDHHGPVVNLARVIDVEWRSAPASESPLPLEVAAMPPVSRLMKLSLIH